MTTTPDISCRGILKLVWPIALGMLNNAVLQFVDGVFLEPIYVDGETFPC